MSRSVEEPRLVSPVEVGIYYNGNTGKFGTPVAEGEGMWDLALPFSFTVLDDGAFRITGETRGAGGKRKIVSNLAHRSFSERLSIRYKDNNETIAEGTWQQIPDTAKKLGCKYTLVLFVLTKFREERIIATVNLRGRALAEWFKFIKGKNPTGDVYYEVTETVKTEGEEVDSYIPVFAEKPLPPALSEPAKEADRAVRAWLTDLFGKSQYGIEQAAPQHGREDTRPDPSFPTTQPAYVEPEPVHEMDDLPF